MSVQRRVPQQRGRLLDLFMAKESFVVTLGRDIVSVKKGDLVRAGHPLLAGREGLFEPAVGFVRFDDQLRAVGVAA